VNQKRIVVCNEGGYLREGLFVLDGALEPAKDYITVLSPAGEAGRSIGLASQMERDADGSISFLVTLEEYLNHDNFEWRVYITGVEYEESSSDSLKPVHFYRIIGKGLIQAIMAHHIRYTPRSNPDE